jgi:predicted phosphohydrolase
MRIGYKSDIHLDFWIGTSNNEKKIENFVKKILSPRELDVLIIAGDLGHYNYQNYLLLKVLKKWAKTILLCLGNHDFYLVSDTQINKYKTSFNRVAEFKEMVDSLDGVYLLDGEVVEIEGVRFLGVNGWYDFSLALKAGYSIEEVYAKWELIMNDSKKIIPKINPLEIAKIAKEKLKANIDKTDIVFTHVPPFYLKCYGDIFFDSFYTFDGYEFLDKVKYWIFGHCHKPFRDKNLYSSPLGYPTIRKGEFGIKEL